MAAKSSEQEPASPEAGSESPARGAAFAAGDPVAAVLALQRAAGNAAVARAVAAGSPMIPPTGRACSRATRARR